jgi:uncharacterized membrane protein YbhN (UPF0104 family)
MKQQENSSRRQLWLGILISVVCLVVIFYFIRPQEIVAAMKTARYGFLVLSAMGIVSFLMIRAARWRFMLNNDAPWLTVFHIQNIGYLISTVCGISTMVVERVLDMLFIVTLLPFTLAGIEYLPDWMRLGARASGVAAIAAISILIIAANQRALAVRIVARILDQLPFLNTQAWSNRTDNFLAGLDSLTRFKDGAILLALTLATWIPIILAYYATMLAVNLQPSLVMAAFVVCAAALSVALPSSPGQIGVFHAGVIAALQVWGQPEAASASFAFIYHALNSITLIVLGIIGIVGTGSTFRHVVASTQDFLNREEANESVSN